MQRSTKQVADFFCATISLLVTSTLNATTLPPISISLSSGTGSNFITSTIGSTSIVEYKIQDLIGRPPARNWLWSAPIPPYITRVQSSHQPDCFSYSQIPGDPTSFTLPPNGTCYFALEVNGNAFAKAYPGLTITYRPMFANSNGIAYGPYLSEILHITQLIVPTYPLLFAVGQYTDTDNTIRPLLIESLNSGGDWIYPESTINPLLDTEPATASVFYGSSCGAKTCIAVGWGEDTYLDARPILALTSDQGRNWGYTPIDPPWYAPDPQVAGTYFGRFNAASCSGNTCIAVGNDKDPLLAVSQDSGMTWVYSQPIHIPIFTSPNTHPYDKDGKFVSASCSGNTCIAVGSYVDSNDDQRPLLALSQNSGTSWTYPDSITAPTLVTNPYASNGQFTSASCYGSTCIAVGYYIDTSSFLRPLLALSQDSGTQWTFVDSITDPSTDIYTFTKSGTLQSATCYGTTCIAGGSYVDSGDIERNLLAVSLDSGSTWTYPNSIQSIGGVSEFLSFGGGVLGTSCYGNLCVAVGNIAGTTTQPFVATSYDSGATWSYVSSMYTPVLPTNPYQENGVLNSVTCNTSACIASGIYLSTSGFGQRPLVALGLNNGSSWSYLDSATSPVFTPKDTYPFTEGRLPSSSASWINLLAHPPVWLTPNSPHVIKK